MLQEVYLANQSINLAIVVNNFFCFLKIYQKREISVIVIILPPNTGWKGGSRGKNLS